MIHPMALLLVPLALAPTEVPLAGPPAPGWQALTPAERLARAEVIRDVAAARGLVNGVLLAGVADAETGMAHCWSEATWACQGPNSPSCGDGPVIAGAGDGPCADQQGGLGMFQFDGGTYAETLARDGEEILLLEGNIDHAVDFVIGIVLTSVYIEATTHQEALEWMNQVPMDPASPLFDAWISTVTRYYNGCQPQWSCWSQRYGAYRDLTLGLWDEMGAAFWMDVESPVCEVIPGEGRVVDDDDACYEEGGNPQYWRTESGGYGDRLRWTHTTDANEADNYGIWHLDFATAGLYRVEVHGDGGTYGRSTQAAYQVHHDGRTDIVIFDQSGAQGFVSIGEFEFAAGAGQYIRLDDNTGEPYATMTPIAFDAIRVSRISNPGAPDAGPDDSSDAGVDGGSSGGCHAGAGGGSGLCLLFFGGLLVLSRRRRKWRLFK